MNRLLTLCIIILLSGFLTGCQKEIFIENQGGISKPVIEGYIEINEYPYVIFTKSIPYFSTVNSENFYKHIMISDAIVCVTSSDGITDTLRYGLYFNAPSLAPLAYVGTKFKGEVGKSYRLDIHYEGTHFTANTAIEPPFEIDSFWFANRDVRDTNAPCRILMTDDPFRNNYYQFMVKVQNANRLVDPYWVSTIPIAFDDQLFSGQTFNYEILRAYPSSLLGSMITNEEERKNFFRMTFSWGDTVYLKYCAIDQPSYKYWSTVSFGDSPFMMPSPAYTNISGGDCFGVWCGRSYKTDTLIIPKWEYPVK